MTQWQLIETVPQDEIVLLGVRGKFGDRFGVGNSTSSGVWVWPWQQRPTHYQIIERIPE